jgi:hypothetical protein
MASVLLVVLLMLTASQSFSPGDKKARTPAQQKINSQLLSAIRRAKDAPATSQGPSEPSERALVKIDRHQRALVDVRAAVTSGLKQHVVRLGGAIVSAWPEADSLIAWVPLLKLEQLAELPSVRAIQPAAQATHK